MQKKNRLMILGGINAGKSTLKDVLLYREIKPAKVKTQALSYDSWIVDTPGEYIENPLFYRNLLATSLEVTHVLFVQDSTVDRTIFAPGFSSGISKIPIGAVTKTDHEDADVERSVELLKRTLVRGPIVTVSAFTNEGVDLIRDLMKLNSLQEMKEYAENSESENIIFHELKKR